jgi:hypothetical protein
MRGRPENNGSLWYSINVEDLIEPGHPLRAMKRMVDEALRGMSDAFSAAYATNGRPRRSARATPEGTALANICTRSDPSASFVGD